MNQRLTTILLSAFLIAAGASYVVYHLVGQQLSNASKQSTKVVVATGDLEIGAVIKPADLKIITLTGPPPKGAMLKPDGAVGRGVLAAIYTGEPILEERLTPPGSGGGLAATIPAGMRACAVRVDDVVSVAGFAVPGMRVDVLISGTMPDDRSASGPKVRTLLQNIAVLSAGKNFQKDNEGKPIEVPVVNLLVTPEQAEVLSLASNQMHIQLVLRNPIDHQVTKPPGTDMANLFGRPEAKPAPQIRQKVFVRAPVPKVEPPPPPPPFLVQVINGAKQTEQRFSSQGDPQ